MKQRCISIFLSLALLLPYTICLTGSFVEHPANTTSAIISPAVGWAVSGIKAPESSHGVQDILMMAL